MLSSHSKTSFRLGLGVAGSILAGSLVYEEKVLSYLDHVNAVVESQAFESNTAPGPMEDSTRETRDKLRLAISNNPNYLNGGWVALLTYNLAHNVQGALATHRRIAACLDRAHISRDNAQDVDRLLVDTVISGPFPNYRLEMIGTLKTDTCSHNLDSESPQVCDTDIAEQELERSRRVLAVCESMHPTR